MTDYEPSEAWWEAQERLHERLMRANDMTDEEERERYREQAWRQYNQEIG